MSSKESSENLETIISNHESGGDVQNIDLTTKFLKSDISENAMLRSRIEEQGQLICYLKQRADHQLKRLTNLEEVNSELHLLRSQTQDESRERYRTCQMLERRFQELSENHEEMIKIKDEYKSQCHNLSVENKALKEQIRKNFSEVITERNKTIEQLKRKLTVTDEKVSGLEERNRRLQKEIDESKFHNKDEMMQYKKDVDCLKKQNDKLTAEVKSLKRLHKQQASKDSDECIALRKEKETLLNEVMERGKLLQDRQVDVDCLMKEAKAKDAKLKAVIEDFNRKQDLVDSNLRVQGLKAERDRLEEEYADLERNFQAFRLHSQSLLDQEKDLNSKLRNNMTIR